MNTLTDKQSTRKHINTTEKDTYIITQKRITSSRNTRDVAQNMKHAIVRHTTYKNRHKKYMQYNNTNTTKTSKK